MSTTTSIVTKAFARAKDQQANGDRSARTAAFVAIMNADLIDRNSGITKPDEETPGVVVARKVLWGRS